MTFVVVRGLSVCLFVLAEQDYGNELEDLHGHASMIKYPNSFFTLPSEKLFVVDRDNLVSAEGKSCMGV